MFCKTMKNQMKRRWRNLNCPRNSKEFRLRCLEMLMELTMVKSMLSKFMTVQKSKIFTPMDKRDLMIDIVEPANKLLVK